MIKYLVSAAVLLSISLSGHSSTLKVATFNIKNYNYDRRTDSYTNDELLVSMLKSLNADLIAVQEIVNTDQFTRIIQNNLKNYKVVMTNCGGSARQKLGFIYNKYNLTLKSFTEWKELSGTESCNFGLRPGAVGRFKIRKTGKEIVAIGVHLKAGTSQSSSTVRKKQYRQITEFIDSMKERNKRDIIVLGDFNTTDYVNSNSVYSDFLDFTKSNELYNYSQTVSCSAYWWGGIDDGLQHGGLLDHVLITHSFHNSYSDFEVSVEGHCKVNNCDAVERKKLGETYRTVSDHCPVSVTLKSK